MKPWANRSVVAILLVALIAATFILDGAVRQPVRAAPAGFAYRCGVHFCLDGNLFYFAGANTYDVFTFGDGSNTATPQDIETKFMNKAQIDAHFARLQQDNVSVLRLWMFSHETWHGFETAKNERATLPGCHAEREQHRHHVARLGR